MVKPTAVLLSIVLYLSGTLLVPDTGGLPTSPNPSDASATAYAAGQTDSPASATQRTVSFLPGQTSSTFLTLLRDESVDVIELNGTYHLPYTVIDIDRARPVTVQPATGATVIFSGTSNGADPQFWFGLNGRAGNITMRGFIFDGFVLGQQGIIQARNCHDIVLNDMVVQNSRSNGTWSKPWHAWAIYLDAASTGAPSDFTANGWKIDGSGQQMSGLQICGGSHITATGWTVSNVCFAVYAAGIQHPLTGLTLDTWIISDSGAVTWTSPSVSVYMEDASGTFSNIQTRKAGILFNYGKTRMTDGGGNRVLTTSSPRSGRLTGSSNLSRQRN